MAHAPLAHSARQPGAVAQTYRAHIDGTTHSEGVVAGAQRRAGQMVCYHRDRATGDAIAAAIEDAAIFHDCGKLDPEIQEALRKGRNSRLVWDHIDAGVAHLSARGAKMAAWIVRAHHSPGLPSEPFHFTTLQDRKLRGRRDDGLVPERHREQIDRTDRLLPEIVEAHEVAIGKRNVTSCEVWHGLALRLGLSCLVDADHGDTAYADNGWTAPTGAPPRWTERLAALDAYVAKLNNGSGPRADLRRSFYQACRDREPDQALIACEGPVGIGKTTAVTAHLLRRAIATRAIATGARRLFIVAPYTAILSQTAQRLREALVLEDERDQPDAIIAEHHHRADFDDISLRDLANLWTAPIILTTAVQFFETLSSNAPSALRKLHALPGSVVFLDEAHAALPVHLWPQNWRWIRELSEDWSCSFVFASGSLVRFWTIDAIVGDMRLHLPDLVSPELVKPLRQAETARVRYATVGPFDGPSSLIEAVVATPGPRLLIMNTVQSAAVMARRMREQGHDVLHISTALCPRDRDEVLHAVVTRLAPASNYSEDWTLVATSLMEAGIDLSFRTPFRERFATTSLIQVGGRGNRHFEWPDGVLVYDFTVAHVEGLKAHPAAQIPANILADLFEDGKLEGIVDPAELVTLAMRKEMRRRRGSGENALLVAEREHRYPCVAKLGRVIEQDTRLVVVDLSLRDRILSRERLSTQEILAGSVQIWANKAESPGLNPLASRHDIFWWPHRYDADFLGYMEGALFLHAVRSGDAIIV